jgi:putative ABC transport system permease protein
MFRNHFKIAWRNLSKSKGFSFINITGLAIGMAVALLIGLWVWDEMSFNKSFENYDHLGQLYQNRTFNGRKATYKIQSQPVSKELRDNYPEFADATLATNTEPHVLAYNDKKISTEGIYAEPQFPKIFTLRMVEGIQNGIDDPSSILLCQSLAKALFGEEAPIGKTVKVDNRGLLTVKGIYKDFARNTEFKAIKIIMPWDYLHTVNPFANNTKTSWGNNNYNCYVQLKENANPASVQKKIFGLIDSKIEGDEKLSKPELLLLPMKDWRLYGEFVDGRQTGGGLITIVRLFAMVGLFVLILACINYMNLSTARSEKRAKEVGVRKTIGSAKSQLIYQFLSESFLITFLSFVLSIGLVSLAIPWFNQLLEKDMAISWSSPLFWTISLGFIIITSLLAGSYPAFYLSSFRPIKVLKGNFRSGRLASLPRKALVVIQFTVSVALIIGTIIVYRQIQFAKDRPMGYDKNGLIYVFANTPELTKLDYKVLRNELLKTNVVENMSKSSSTMSDEGNLTTGFTWDNNPNSDVLFTIMSGTEDHTKTIGLELIKGRDFLPDFKSDSTSVLLNETAAKLVGEKDVIGKVMSLFNTRYTVIGIVKDQVRSSPYSKVMPGMFMKDRNFQPVINIRIKPTVAISAAMGKIGDVFNKLNPAVPFESRFADELVAKSFETEILIGKLSTFFAFLAIFISCLGIFGLASFIAEQRTKEIGVRKVLGASVFNVWRLLSKDFIILVVISFIIAAPIAWYFMHDWLKGYEYHTPISWWVYVVTCAGAVLITLGTVSFQAIKAAIANPVKSLRTE